MTDFAQIDYFSDQSVIDDPYPYFDYLRSQCPVLHDPHSGVVAVTGYDELNEIYRDTETFSSINSCLGAFPLPFTPEGDDITAQIEAHREQFPMHEHLPSFDPPKHGAYRTLLAGLFTPKRLKENEEYMWGLADRLLDEFVADGRCEFVSTFAKAFPLLVITDLLGVPEDDHAMFRDLLAPGMSGRSLSVADTNPIAALEEWFTRYIEDRRRHPRGDMLTELATTRLPDGTLPEVAEVVHISTFLFFAGQETTARLLASSLQLLALRPELQETLRSNRDRIPNFVEEMLRMESPIKSDFRLARKATTLAGVDIAVGTTVMLLPGAANRDPDHFQSPHEFQLDRANVRHQVAFGKGPHTCPGGPLARVEGRVSLERILDRTSDIRLSETHHGPASARRFEYDPLWLMRGLTELHLEFTARPSGPDGDGINT
jgi:cytochrome P450